MALRPAKTSKTFEDLRDLALELGAADQAAPVIANLWQPRQFLLGGAKLLTCALNKPAFAFAAASHRQPWCKRIARAAAGARSAMFRFVPLRFTTQVLPQAIHFQWLRDNTMFSRAGYFTFVPLCSGMPELISFGFFGLVS